MTDKQTLVLITPDLLNVQLLREEYGGDIKLQLPKKKEEKDSFCTKESTEMEVQTAKLKFELSLFFAGQTSIRSIFLDLRAILTLLNLNCAQIWKLEPLS